ncbi:hypothetical protein [Haladaptatus sp. AB643]|uniref:DUF7528 family protein n=1 Tax=unclassified Haladaptatus TaxID=2622732 RepID=UPI00209BCAF1|nr:hypothetical protein [Haladaptatus sp. AB643]MCO8253171.1 hypothetical protein [Haladaptatus sp. AB618]
MSLTVSGETHELTRREATHLREVLGRALTERREYLYTAGEYRDDGSYVVSRRGADSAGHRKVFERFDVLVDLYDRLPGVFTADDVDERGLTGGRRHILVHHFAEHPEFDCELVSRQPLTVQKESETDG